MKRAIYAFADMMATPGAFIALNGATVLSSIVAAIVGSMLLLLVTLTISVITQTIGHAVLVAASRDGIALHVKLDQIIAALPGPNTAIGIEHEDAEVIERERQATERRAGLNEPGGLE
jgi:low affinity Fe/Cu permease